MGLHSRTRYAITLKSHERMAQENEIIQFATRLYDFIFDFVSTDESTSLVFTQKLARFVSKAFTFAGYEDDEIYRILLREADKRRKPR